MDLPCNLLYLLLECKLFSSLGSLRFALYLSVMTDAIDKVGIDKDIDNWEIAADRHYTLASTTFTKRRLR